MRKTKHPSPTRFFLYGMVLFFFLVPETGLLAQCERIIYVTPGGVGAGSLTDPTDLQTAITLATSGTVIRMSIGTYTIDNPISTVRSGVTLEGGFDGTNGWGKTSLPGATKIYRSALNPEGGTVEPRLVALYFDNKSDFRLQDLTIETADATQTFGKGMSTYGIHFKGCSNYHIVRVRIKAGNAGDGTNGSNGQDGSNGTGGSNGTQGDGDSLDPCGDGGTGGTGGGGNSGGSGAICQYFPSAHTGGGAGSPNTTVRTRTGGGGGGGGRGNVDEGKVGRRGGYYTSGTTPGGAYHNCAGGDDGSNGQNGNNGADGSDGTQQEGTTSSEGFFIPGDRNDGIDGEGGAGGWGGGGGGGQIPETVGCVAGTGSGGGGGGGGGQGGSRGTGGYGGGGSFAAFLFDNGANGHFIDCELIAGQPGEGGSGGSGGDGGFGGSGGAGAPGQDEDVGAGGNGGVGGKGGNGGDGADGADGLSMSLYHISGDPLTTDISGFDLDAQPVVEFEISEQIGFSGPSSQAWDLGAGADPQNPTGMQVVTYYDNFGRRDIQFGTAQYSGFINFAGNPCVLYVDASASGHNNGSCWQHAFTDLQAAIDKARSGYCEIWVAAGSYSPSLDISGMTPAEAKNKTFYFDFDIGVYGGFDGTEKYRYQRNWRNNETILDGSSDQVRSVVHTAGVTSEFALDGFTITGGHADATGPDASPQATGGGWFNDGLTSPSSPTIRNCIFRDNFAEEAGGAFFNAAIAGEASPYFENCLFVSNTTDNNGGGIANEANSGTGNLEIFNCTFYNNSATVHGGALYNAGTSGTCSPIITNTIMWSNTGNGKSIFNLDATPVLSYSLLEEVTCPPGAVCNAGVILGQDPEFYNAPVFDLVLNGCSPAIDAGIASGSPNLDLDGHPRPANGGIDMGCYEYQSNRFGEIPCFMDADGDGFGDLATEMSMCVPCLPDYVEDHTDCDDAEATTYPGAPEMCDGVDNDCNWLTDDGFPYRNYYLDLDGDGYGVEGTEIYACSSPGANYKVNTGDCNDGDNTVHPNAKEFCNNVDNDCDGLIDEGCCPQGAILYVDAAALGKNNGSSWQDAFTDLQDALHSTCSGITQIRVAEGLYRPTSGSDRTISFVMKSGVSISGGYRGGDTSPDDRNALTYRTILSGDIGVEGDDGDNSYHVVANQGASGTINGFIITGGNADGDSPHNDGGGVHLSGSGFPNISGCKIVGNKASRYGGGIYNDVQGASSLSPNPTITDNYIEDNEAANGGGLYNDMAAIPRLERSVFRSNRALINGANTGLGGGLYYKGSIGPQVSDCSFIGNDAETSGGGSYSTGTNVNYTSCVFVDNTASSNGGAVFCLGSPVDFTNCRFVWNEAENGNGGAIYNEGVPSTADISLCTFKGNKARLGGAIANKSSSPDIDGSVFIGNEATEGGGIYNDDSYPDVTFCSLSGNTASIGGGFFNINSIPFGDFMTISETISWGNGASSFPEIFDDPSSETWITNSIIGQDPDPFADDWDFNVENDDPKFSIQPTVGRGTSGFLYLMNTSPAIDGSSGPCGINNCVETDILGVCRPYGTSPCPGTANLFAYDLGAYEYDFSRSNLTSTCYEDLDGDNYGNAAESWTFCFDCPKGFSFSSLDCNDANSAIRPFALEICNNVDDDCDGTVDDGVSITSYLDSDGDGYGDPDETADSCPPPVGYVFDDNDCDDADPAEHPNQLWYSDGDSDGWGGSRLTACERPVGYFLETELTGLGDCDDHNDTVYPGASEACNGIDDDCDNVVDDGLTHNEYFLDSDDDGYGTGLPVNGCQPPGAMYVLQNGDCDDTDTNKFPGQSWYFDYDRDGYGTGSPILACQAPGNDYATNDGDCDDNDELEYPGQTWYEDNDGDGYGGASQTSCTRPAGLFAAAELTGINDCDDSNPSLFMGVLWYADDDSDGYGDPGSSIVTCSTPAGYVMNDDDCNDNDSSIKPGATEECNGVDDNCDGQVDEGVQTTYYADADGDGYGDPSSTIMACSPPAGYVANDDDCNDGDSAIKPGVMEVCNGLDDNCDGQVDEGVQTTFYADTDGDGYGDASSTVMACSPPGGYVANDDDCNDSDNSIKPGATEVCNGVDDNCDGNVDEGVQTTYYADIDGDGFGDPSSMIMACSIPTGYVTDNTDCNDGDAAIKPGATEVCNGVDDNCDGNVDEGVQTTYYADTDEDGYGDPASTTLACSQPIGFVANDGDCDDTDGDEYPGQEWYSDDDGDGWGGVMEVACGRPVDKYLEGELTGLDDCNDTDANEYPGQQWYSDDDGDGWGGSMVVACTRPAGKFYADELNGLNDCDDTDGDEYPGQEWYSDDDGDGWGGTVEVACARPTGKFFAGELNGSGDCDDANGDEYPGQEWYADVDGDGWGGALEVTCARPAGKFLTNELTGIGDCDDTNMAVNPDATEICNGIDDDCINGIDDGQTIMSYYLDNDNDGFGSGTALEVCESPGTNYVLMDGDCDDMDSDEYPGQEWYTDGDGDGWGGQMEVACERPAGKYLATELTGLGDCDDNDANEYPGQAWYADADGDGWGGQMELMCERPVGKYLATELTGLNDCDDNDANEYPGQAWYADADGDGWGGQMELMCERPVGKYLATELTGLDDCDDNDADEYPGQAWYADADGDGWGGQMEVVCERPVGKYLATELTGLGDCDDNDANEYPGQAWYADADGDGWGGQIEVICERPVGRYLATELTGLDDCDDNDDDEYPGQAWYADNDGDGWGGQMEVVCERPVGRHLATELTGLGDCDDNDDDEYPGQAWYADDDGDGWGGRMEVMCERPVGKSLETELTGLGDCDDNDVLEYPGQAWYADADGDGWGGQMDVECERPVGKYLETELTGLGDCDDADADEYPGQEWYADADGDGWGGQIEVMCERLVGRYLATELTGLDDCDDNDAYEYPGQVWYQDADRDGWGNASIIQCMRPAGWFSSIELNGISDCDDNNAAINPGALESCNGLDDDCNGLVDQADPGLVDTEVPDAMCQDISINLGLDGTVHLEAYQLDGGSTDNCGIVNLSINQSEFGCQHVGLNVVNLTVTDGHGNISVCQSEVMIEDRHFSIPAIAGPEFICPGINGLVYEVPFNPDVFEYVWTYTGTGVTIHQSSTAMVRLDFTPQATAGVLSVELHTVCGSAGATALLPIEIADELTCELASCLRENTFVDDEILAFAQQIDVFRASISIGSDAVIAQDRHILFIAGQDIRLYPGFEVEVGGSFEARIEPCDVSLQGNGFSPKR